MHFMNQRHREDPHSPLSYHGAWRIVWLIFFLFIVWLILRALQPVILLFALVFLIAMVLNPIVVWLHKHRVPRFASVILLVLALIALTTTIIVFAIPPLTTQMQELLRSAPKLAQGLQTRIESLTRSYPAVRGALPRTDEIASKVAAAAATIGNILLRSTLGLVGGVASVVTRHFVADLCARHPAPAGGRVSGARARPISPAGAPDSRAHDATDDRLGARRSYQWHYHRSFHRRITFFSRRATGAHLRRIGFFR